MQLNLFTFYITGLIHICFFRKTTSLRSYSTSSVLSYHSRVGEGYFWKPKENTDCRIFFTRLCALSENNLDYSAVFALVFAIDSYPALTSLVRWQNKTSIDRRLMLIDSQQLFLKEIPEEKWKLWHFTFYCKVDTQKIQNLILNLFLICVIQRFSPPLLVFLLHCSFSNLCPLCRHKTGWESCWTTAHVKFTWTKILHGSFMGICDGRIKLQSCWWSCIVLISSFMLKLAFFEVYYKYKHISTKKKNKYRYHLQKFEYLWGIAR